MEIRLIADGTLGGFVKLMRMIGFDVEFLNTKDFSQVINKAKAENRIVVTRRRKIDSFSDVRVISLEENYPLEQVKKVLDILNLKPDPEKFLSRCLICNLELEEVSKEEVKERVPPFVYEHHNEFSRCPHCKRIYWDGTHIANMKLMVKNFYDKEL
jgi:uncharacterized protein with PIN domain